MRFKTSPPPDDPRPNITSLVDVLFLLIIFFTVTTTFVTSGGIDVNLPQASTQRQIEKVEKLFVVVNKKGVAFVQGQKKSDAELADQFSSLKTGNSEAIVVIQADQATHHGRVVEIMDMAQAAGLSRLAIATEAKREPAPIKMDEPDKSAPDDQAASEDEKDDKADESTDEAGASTEADETSMSPDPEADSNKNDTESNPDEKETSNPHE